MSTNNLIEPMSPNIVYGDNSDFLADLHNTVTSFINNNQSFITHLNNKVFVISLLDSSLSLENNNNILNHIEKTKKETLDEILGKFHYLSEKGFTFNVNTTGIKNENTEIQKVGSSRFCIQNKNLSSVVNYAIKQLSLNQYVEIDNEKYLYEGVSKYWRFMSYNQGGEHYPHYDSDFNTFGNQYTKFSCVVYFTDCKSGELAFIDDKTEFAENKEDWDRQATDSEIVLKIKPKALDVVIFPHDMCHSVLPFKKDYEDRERVIARGDLIYSKVS